jgi:hypothetical protein
MSRFTKTQRNEIYKKAFSLVERLISQKSEILFLCTAISSACYHLHGIYDADTNIKIDFPELYAFKPKNKYGSEVWFDVDWEGEQKRIEILKAIIKETENDAS